MLSSSPVCLCSHSLPVAGISGIWIVFSAWKNQWPKTRKTSNCCFCMLLWPVWHGADCCGSCLSLCYLVWVMLVTCNVTILLGLLKAQWWHCCCCCNTRYRGLFMNITVNNTGFSLKSSKLNSLFLLLLPLQNRTTKNGVGFVAVVVVVAVPCQYNRLPVSCCSCPQFYTVVF